MRLTGGGRSTFAWTVERPQDLSMRVATRNAIRLSCSPIPASRGGPTTVSYTVIGIAILAYPDTDYSVAPLRGYSLPTDVYGRPRSRIPYRAPTYGVAVRVVFAVHSHGTNPLKDVFLSGGVEPASPKNSIAGLDICHFYHSPTKMLRGLIVR